MAHPVHIYGYQDQHTLQYDQLERLLQINVRIEWLEKTGNAQVKDNVIIKPMLMTHPFGFPVVTFYGKLIQHRLIDSLYAAI